MDTSFLNESNRIVTSNLHDLFHHATNHQSLYSQNVFLYIIVYDHPPLIGGIKATVSPSFNYSSFNAKMLNYLHLGLGLRLKATCLLAIQTGVKSFDLAVLTRGDGQIVVDHILHLMPMLNYLHLGLVLLLAIPTGVESFDLAELTLRQPNCTPPNSCIEQSK